jgi:simple sugar transport system ATP-binding protein
VLHAQKISKSYGSNRVNIDISLRFERGTVTAIVGDNGAGKSTFLKILAGSLRPSTGTLSLDEKALTDFSPHIHRSCGIEMVYQDLALARNHDIVTNIFAGREITKALGCVDLTSMRTRAREILESLEVHGADLDSPVGSLSGGQQQSVAIARALLFSPKVLLFDEPTAALGAREVARVLELIREQKRAGRIVIFVSHRLNDVFEVSDRIVVFKKGRVHSDDPTQRVSMTKIVELIVS